MKNIYKALLKVSILAMLIFSLQFSFAGNKDRSGQAAAQHLLISPWGASNGWGTVGISSTKGVEATFSNVAGMAFTRKTEIGYTNTLYCYGSSTNINALGVVQSLGEERGNLGLSVMIMSLGDITTTTVNNPEGGLGTFSPMLMSLGLSYAKSFSTAIHAGASVKLISENTSDITAIGFAIDAGIQYVTGKYDQFQIGVALKNIGLPMSYKGDGLDFRGYAEGSNLLQTFSNRSQSYEMPALLSLGLSYDFLFGGVSKMSSSDESDLDLNRETAAHRITLAGAFVSNAYSKDQFVVGLEYSLMNLFQIRGGYTIESGMWKSNTNTSVYLGPSCGTSILIPLGKKTKSRVAIDYAYRFTVQWKGSHSIGARIIL
jgi:hypothetical protein